MNLFQFMLLIFMFEFCAGYFRYMPYLPRRLRRHELYYEPPPIVLLRPRRYIPVRPYWSSLRPQIAMLPDDFDMMDNDQCGGGGGGVNTGGRGGGGSGGGGRGFGKAEIMSDGNPKHKASNIAQQAAQDAKSAMESQAGAAREASRTVKMQLAEKALQAAKAAEAALSGKQQIVEQLEQEVRDAEIVVQEQTSALQNSQTNVQAAVQAAKQAQQQLRTLAGMVQLAQATVGNAEQVATGSQQDLVDKTSVLEVGKNRLEDLKRQLSAAKADFANTKQAAYKAAAAAHEAKTNASRSKRKVGCPSHDVKVEALKKKFNKS